MSLTMSPHSLLSKNLVFGLLVLLVAFGASCAARSVHTPTPVEPLSPLEVLQQSNKRGKDIKSFRAHMDMEITTPDEGGVITIDMEAGTDGRVRTLIEIDSFGDKQSIETIIAEPHVYVDVPGRGWVQMSAEAVARSAGQPVEAISDPTAFYSSLFPAQKVPWELYVVESLGREEVDGVETERLSIKFDFQKIWQHLDEEQKQQFFQTSLDPELTKEELVEAMEVRGLEVWIDDQGYPRRTVMEIVFSGEALVSLDGEASMKLDMRMFDINEEITIRLPEGYQDFERDAEPVVVGPPTSVYEELLELIPDSPDARSIVFLND